MSWNLGKEIGGNEANQTRFTNQTVLIHWKLNNLKMKICNWATVLIDSRTE